MTPPARGPRGATALLCATLSTALPAALLTGCGGPAADAAPAAQEEEAPEVTARRPTRADVTEYLTFTGRLEATERVEVRPRVSGYLDKVHYTDGQSVQEGDPLFQIDPRPYEAALREAQAEVARQEALVRQARWVLERNQKAAGSNAVSELAVVEAEADLAQREAQKNLAEAAAASAALDLGFASIHAPIPGVVGRRLVDEGNLVGDAERTLLAVIVRQDPIYAYFPVSERELARLGDAGEGAGRAEVALGKGGEFAFAGELDYASNEIDSATGTRMLRAVVPNPEPGPLVPGAFVRVRVPLGELTDAVTVPQVSLQRDQSGDYLYTLDDEDQVVKTYVQLGPRDGRDRVIAEGLGGQERVIVAGIQRAQPGAKVRPSIGEPEPQSPEDAATGGGA